LKLLLTVLHGMLARPSTLANELMPTAMLEVALVEVVLGLHSQYTTQHT
jgi:hypothetical protein